MKYFNRYTQEVEQEKTPGEACLKFLYKTFLGKLFLHLFFKRSFVSKLFGWFMKLKNSRKKILPFAEKYAIDLNLFEKKPHEYSCFNDFFCRKFKAGIRPINSEENTICFPTDGRHFGFQNIDESQTFTIKGRVFNLEKLLKDKNLAKQYYGGTCIISRLAPTDYHRFHFPCDGIPQASYCINGVLFSVSPIALKKNFRILGENKRWLTHFYSKKFGHIVIIEVGATCVGSVVQTYLAGNPVKKGDEKGYFSLGGSTVVTLFEHDKITLSEDLKIFTQRGIELYAHMGDVLGKATIPFKERYPKIEE